MSGSNSYKPVIFISHSAKDAVARETLAKLYTALHQEYEVLLDRKRLLPTDPWRQELHTWMGLCQGAVLLLSEDALHRSDWVRKEATVLSYRREMDDQFILVPVLIPPVDADSLKRERSFAPLELDAIQAVCGTPEEIVEQVLESLKPLKNELDQRAPLRKIEKSVGKILSDLAHEERAPLIAAAAKLGKRLPWSTRERYGEQLARELLSVELDKAVKVLEYLANSIPGSGKKLAEVLTLLSPFWVNPDAALELVRMHKRSLRQRAVRVNGAACPFTGKSYIRRARIDKDLLFASISHPPRVWEELKPEAKLDALIQEIHRQLELGFEEGEEPSGEDIERQVRNIGNDEPMFVIVPKGFDENLLGMLRERLESFTFFMLGGDESAFAAPELKDWEVLFLKPELAPGYDEKFQDLIESKRSGLKRTK